MKIIIKIFLTLLLVSSFLNGKENKVLAQVEDYSITDYQVNALVTSKLQKTFFHQNLSDETKKKLNKDALEELIERELLYRYAKEKKIIVDDNVIDEIKETIIKRFPSKEVFEETLKKNNLTIDILKRDIDAEETMKLLYKKEIESDLSQDELKAYYQENKHKFVKPESKSIQILLIHIDPSKKDSIKEAKEKISKLREEILAGGDFDKIAREHSNDMSRINGGKVGFIHKGRFKYLDDKDLDLKVNEVSEVIQTDIGFYVVKVLEFKDKEQLSFEAVEKNLKKELKETEEKRKLNRILEKQRGKLKIKYF